MTDRYTKIVLTVIACALVAIAGENAIPKASAEYENPMKVQICDLSDCARLHPTIDNIRGQAVVNWAVAVVPYPK